jgi:hypothetical protein
MKKSEKRLLIVMGLAVVIFLVDRFVLGKKKDGDIKNSNLKTTASTVKPLSVLKSGKGSQSLNLAGKNKTKYFTDWGRDPFQISVKPPTQIRTGEVQKVRIRKPKLKGIFWKQGKGYVLLDDLILAEGEEKRGIRVVSIGIKEVLCRKAGNLFTLYWREPR